MGPLLVIQSDINNSCSLEPQEHQSAGQRVVPSVKLEHFFITNIQPFQQAEHVVKKKVTECVIQKASSYFNNRKSHTPAENDSPS